MTEMSVRQWQERFRAGTFTSDDVRRRLVRVGGSVRCTYGSFVDEVRTYGRRVRYRDGPYGTVTVRTVRYGTVRTVGTEPDPDLPYYVRPTNLRVRC